MPLYPFHLRALMQSGGASQSQGRPNASTPIGIASFVIGGLAMLVAWIPYIGMLAVPVAGFGAIVGFVGIIVGRMAGQRRVFVPFGAMLLCGISILVSYGSTYAWQNRPGAPGSVRSTPAQPAIDMTRVTGPFVPKPVTQPTFVMPEIKHPTTLPQVERAD